MQNGDALKAPFPWFGGKSCVAAVVWDRFGNVANYVEPFFGSGAVLLGRPGGAQGIETVNDKDGFVANAWRSIALSPEETAQWADWPVNENDLHGRHVWLRERREALSRRLEADPDYHDPKIAGWWLWGMACWIGGGFCGESGSGPWGVVDEGGVRQLVHLGGAGQGVTRQRAASGLAEYFTALSERMRRVRVCSGDWSRVLGPTPTVKLGMTGVFLDPPYPESADRDMNVYAQDCGQVAHEAHAWAVDHGHDPLLRIAFCGYEGTHVFPEDWTEVPWKANGGYGNQSANPNGRGSLNADRERIWFSPACLGAAQGVLPL